jgi:large subunit ribosomal protein L4
MADSTNLQASAFTAQGTAREKVALPSETFDGTVNMPAMHLAVKAYLANQRQGTHATKTRRWVVGGNQKPWRQKGTGRARQGSIRAPNWPGGGTVFGPQPRSYRQDITRQAKALARKSALNARAAESSLHVIDAFQYDAPKTSRLVQLLARLDVAHQKVLILTDGVKPNVFLSGRNLPNVHVMPYSDVATYHLLWSDVVLVESAALGTALEPKAEKELAKVKVVKSKKAAATGERGAASADEEKGEAKTAGKAKATKAAAKKSAPKAAAKKAPAKKAAPKTTAKKSSPKKKGK